MGVGHSYFCMSIALERRIQEIEIISLIPCLIDEKIKARRIGSW